MFKNKTKSLFFLMSLMLSQLAQSDTVLVSEKLNPFGTDAITNLGSEFGVSVSIDSDFAFVAQRVMDNSRSFGYGANGAGFLLKKNELDQWVSVDQLISYHFDLSTWLSYSPPLSYNSNSVISQRDGVAVLGASSMSSTESAEGSIFIYSQNSQDEWDGSGVKFVDDPVPYGNFGRSVATANGVVAAGATGALPNGGAVYLFSDQAAGWEQLVKITPSIISASANFGVSVDISENYLVVGASYDTVDSVAYRGSAFVFEKDLNGDWVEVTKLPSPTGSTYFFGQSVAVSGDKLVVGAYSAVFVYSRDVSGSWVQIDSQNAASLSANSGFGEAVAIHGEYIAVGATGTGSQGEVHLFGLDEEGTLQVVAKLLASDGQVADYFGTSVSISASEILIGRGVDASMGGENGSAYVYEYNIDFDGDGIPDFLDIDDDNDGMPDDWELQYGFDSLNADDAELDTDDDERSNIQEYLDGTDPTVWDFFDIPVVTEVQISGGILPDELNYSVTLESALPDGYGVFVNFDNQQGGWYTQYEDGGHFALSLESSSTYSEQYIFNRAGLRSVRAGVFRLADGSELSEDLLIGDYSAATMCVEAVCLNAITKQNGIGNPAISGSGSQLADNVDVGSGNFHFSSQDLVVAAKGISFAFSRAYNSQSSTPWSFGYEARIRYLSETFEREVSIGPKDDGRYQYYYKELDYLGGKWYPLDPGNFDQLVENTDGSFTQYTRGNRVYQYGVPDESNVETTGQLTRIEDRLGNGLGMSHVNGKLSSITDANGETYSIQRDSSDRIVSVNDHAGRGVGYSYNAAGLLSEFTNARGFSTGFGYTGSSADAMLEILTDPRQNALINLIYNADGQVASVTNALGDTTSFIYDRSDAINGEGTGVVMETVDGINNSKIYLLDDSRHCVTGIIDAENVGDFRSETNRIGADNRNEIAKTCLVAEYLAPANQGTGLGTSYQYTDDGRTKAVARELTGSKSLDNSLEYKEEDSDQPNLRPLTLESRAGIVFPRTYSSFSTTGKAGEITDSRGSTTSRTYDGNGWVEDETDPQNGVTRYTYYPTGLVNTVTGAMGGVTTYDYDSVGRVIEEISSLGLVTTYEYDANGNLTRSNDKAAGIDYTTTYEYDASDNLIRMVDPVNLETTYTYDAMNRRIGESYIVGSDVYARVMEYDALGRMFRVTDERNNKNRTYFTARSLVSKREDGRGEIVTEVTYDANGNVETITDGENRMVSYVYDALDRKTSASYDDGATESWQYDDAGRVSTYTDKQDRDTSYEYDDEGNLERTTDANGGVTEAYYDGVGNVVWIKDPNNNKTSYAYDALNRRISTELPDGQTWVYSYDAAGNMISETTPTNEKIEKQFDALGRVTQLTERTSLGSVARSIAYSYDENGNVTLQSSGGNSINYQYDKINRVVSVTDESGQTVDYGYDRASNRTSITYPGNLQVQYQYDEAGRMQSLQDWLGNQTIYTRNAAGQITRAVNGNGTQSDYAYDNLGRLKELTNKKAQGDAISQHILSYDQAGNITGIAAEQPQLVQMESAETEFVYDINNFITQAGPTQFEVDEAGRLIEEDESGQVTTYQFNVDDLITEVTQGNQIVTTYDYDLQNNRISKTQDGVEKRYLVDQLAQLPSVLMESNAEGIAQVRYVYGEGLVSRIEADNDMQYYHFDQTGHTIALTDSNGSITDQYAYTPYGETASSGQTDNPFRYVGRSGVMDDGNGLHYMRARYYRQDISRFLSLDVVEGNVSETQLVNRYSYVSGNPIARVDPSGNSYVDGIFKIVIGAVVVTGAVLAAPVIGAGAGLAATTFAVTTVITGVTGGAALLAGGVTQIAATATVSNKNDLSSINISIDKAIQVSDMFYAGGYVVSGGNESVADSVFQVGQIVRWTGASYSLANSAIGLGTVPDLYDYTTAPISFSSSLAGENSSANIDCYSGVGPLTMSQKRC